MSDNRCEATLCPKVARWLVIANTRTGQRSMVSSSVCGQHLASYVREFATAHGVTVLPINVNVPGSKS